MNWLKRIFQSIFARYDATQYSQFRSWRSTPLQDARLDVTKATREVLQAKSRDFERNSPLYTKIADTIEQYTVGTGIQLASASSDPVWNIAADQVWENWKPIADMQSRFGFDNLQGVIARTLFVDGECFVLLTREGPYPRIQLIESHRCKTPKELEAYEGEKIVDGVQIDSTGRPVFYYFDGKPVTAADVVHIYEPGRVGQYRGIPYCTAALNTLHDLEDLKILEMRANKDAASRSTVIKTASGELPPAMQSMAQKFRSASTATGTSGTVTESKREFYKNTVGGETLVLQSGDDVSQHIPQRPGVETREYWRLLASEVCVCAGTPLSIIYPDSQQGTVFRGSLDAFAAFCRNKTVMLAGYFKRIRNYVIQVEATYNRELARLPADWRKTSNGTVRAPNVDIGRNSTAMINELAAGTRDWDGIAAELGESARDIATRKADFLVFCKKIAQERGLELEQIISAQLPSPEQPLSPQPQDNLP